MHIYTITFVKLCNKFNEMASAQHRMPNDNISTKHFKSKNFSPKNDILIPTDAFRDIIF